MSELGKMILIIIVNGIVIVLTARFVLQIQVLYSVLLGLGISIMLLLIVLVIISRKQKREMEEMDERIAAYMD